MKQGQIERIVIATIFLFAMIIGLTVVIIRSILCYCFSVLTDKFCTDKHKK